MELIPRRHQGASPGHFYHIRAPMFESGKNLAKAFPAPAQDRRGACC